MTESRDANTSWLARRRESRRAKRQEERERELFAAQQAQSQPGAKSRLDAHAHTRWDGMGWGGGFWGGGGGDWGGGCGGGDGGGGGGC